MNKEISRIVGTFPPVLMRVQAENDYHAILMAEVRSLYKGISLIVGTFPR